MANHLLFPDVVPFYLDPGTAQLCLKLSNLFTHTKEKEKKKKSRLRNVPSS